MAVDEEQRQARVAEAPGPGGVAVDPPAGLVPLDHGGSTEQFQEFVDHWGEELTAPAEVTEQAGSADGQAEEVVEQVAGLAQGDAEVGPAVAGEQAGARADVRARQFQVAAALAGPLTAPAAGDISAVAMPFDLGLRKIGQDVIFVLAGGFEINGPALGTLLRVDVVFDEDGAGRGWGRKHPGCWRCSWRRRSVRGLCGSSRRWGGRLPRCRILRSWCSTWASRRRRSALSASKSAIRCSREATRAERAAWASGGIVFQRGGGIGGGAAIPSTTRYLYREFGLAMAPVSRKSRTARDEPLNSYRTATGGLQMLTL